MMILRAQKNKIVSDSVDELLRSLVIISSPSDTKVLHGLKAYQSRSYLTLMEDYHKILKRYEL